MEAMRASQRRVRLGATMPYNANPPLPSGRRPLPADWDELRAGVDAWLKDNWGTDKQCPYCGNPDWEIGEVVALSSAPADWPIAARSRRGAYLGLPVTCTRCGHMVLLNALWIFRKTS